MLPRLLAVAHGSRQDRSLPPLEGLIGRLRRMRPELAVQLAFVDHRSPSVSAALRSNEPTVVVPLLLSAASHVKGDIAAAVRAAGSHVVQARPLVPHIGVVQALAQRLEEAAIPADRALVLAAIGAADPDANAQVVTEARRLWEWRGGAGDVEAAFASATRPSVPEAVDRLRRLGNEHIAIVEFALAPGFLLDRAIGSVSVDAVTEPVADTEPIARAVLERYDEARTQDVRMGCDTCIYRVPWPGLQERVGTVQRVHPHPDDP